MTPAAVPGRLRIELQARIFVRGTCMESDELENMVVEGLLSERRRWRRDETIVDCFGRTMRRMVQDYWRRVLRDRDVMVTLSADDDDHNLQDHDRIFESDEPDPERTIQGRQDLDSILTLLSNEEHPEDPEIARLHAEGESYPVISQRLNLNETEIENARMRIRRALKAVQADDKLARYLEAAAYDEIRRILDLLRDNGNAREMAQRLANDGDIAVIRSEFIERGEKEKYSAALRSIRFAVLEAKSCGG